MIIKKTTNRNDLSWKIWISFILFPFFVIRCSSPHQLTETNYREVFTLPGCVKISDNFYCDQAEVNNVGWREYLLWVGHVFGTESEEYKTALPDTTVWIGPVQCLSGFADYYFRHPSFNNHPVVGVTQQQAKAFADWRSDRVFELLLITLKKIDRVWPQTPENYFTREKYFKGSYKGIMPGEKLKYYPEYRLMTIAERKIIIHYADSVQTGFLANCNTKFCRECKSNDPWMISDIKPCIGDSMIRIPTGTVYDACNPRKNGIYLLRGNVAEWQSELNVAAGGGWFDSKSKILVNDNSQTLQPNAWTGFRDVCEWKSFDPAKTPGHLSYKIRQPFPRFYRIRN